MQAVRFIGNGRAVVEEAPMPAPQPGQALLKIHTTALCGSENKAYLSEEGMQGIPGHELTGEVVETNGTQLIQTGDRVAVHVLAGCGECAYCREGYPQFCAQLHMSPANGSHAEYTAVPEESCLKLPEEMSYDLGVLAGGDTAGVAYRVTTRLPLRPGQVALVTGAGPVGLGVTIMLKFLGAYVAVSEPSAYRREFAMQRVGADLTLDPFTEDVGARLRELTGGLGPDIVVECSGQPEAQRRALEWVRCQGTVVYAGENMDGLNIVPTVHIIHKEVRLQGAFYFAPKDFTGILGMMQRGLDLEPLISHRFPLSEAPKAFELFLRKETGKVLLHP